MIRATSITETFTSPKESATFTVEIEEFNRIMGADYVCSYGGDAGIIIKVPVKFGSTDYIEFNAYELGIDVKQDIQRSINRLIAYKVRKAFKELTNPELVEVLKP